MKNLIFNCGHNMMVCASTVHVLHYILTWSLSRSASPSWPLQITGNAVYNLNCPPFFLTHSPIHKEEFLTKKQSRIDWLSSPSD